MDRRSFLGATLASALLSGRSLAQSEPLLRPEDFGARGDGATNDSAAFSLLSARVRHMGGGTIQLAPGKTYVVGAQRRGADRAFSPSPLLTFENLERPLTIIGNGARLRAEAGLGFGAFDPHTRLPVQRQMPNVQEPDRASPYLAMILVRGARSPVIISDIELDGNVAGLLIGGRWGDTGYQVPGSGIALYENLAEERISNVFSHHHPLDGVMIDGAELRNARSHFTRLVCQGNGRQGLSLVGGSGYDFEDFDFSRTGQSGVQSAPGAGVDIEAENHKRIRDVTFARCKFRDNAGPGLIGEGGDSSGVSFADCEFVGTTDWAAVPNRPRFSFDRCTFAGTVIQAHASAVPAEATKFRQCRFTDNPKMSPTGDLFVGGKAGDGIVNLGSSDNIQFDRCVFDLDHRGVLPWSWRAIYQDCTMGQASSTPAMTKGKYLGNNVIDGPVELYGSMIVGTLILNGKSVPKGPVGSDFVPW